MSEVNNNIHALSAYSVTAPNVTLLYAPWIVKAQFMNQEGKAFTGGDLFVQCLLVGPAGQFQSFVLQDDGIVPDEKSSDGVYTGQFIFRYDKAPRDYGSSTSSRRMSTPPNLTGPSRSRPKSSVASSSRTS